LLGSKASEEKIGAEKTQARNRVKAMADKLGGFVHFPPKFPKLNTVQEPQQTPFF
jgi:hypothetical protein